MNYSLPSNLWDSLVCSYCGDSLEKINTGAKCSRCGSEFKYSEYGSLDLRLKRPKKYPLEFLLGDPLPHSNQLQFEPLEINPEPEVNFADLKVEWHLPKEILSYIPKAKSPRSSLMLDLGCGSASHKNVCEYAGYEWIGLDYDSSMALILGDAHSLPFKDDTFEFILSIAVLEHIRFPFVMMKETYRVLKPHGRFIGTVAFLEPFHGNSFYHHTHFGTLNSLIFGGFNIEKIAPSKQWSGLEAQASMGLFPKMPHFMSKSLVFPLQLLAKLWWQVSSVIFEKANKPTLILNTTGAFSFVATKMSAEKHATI